MHQMRVVTLTGYAETAAMVGLDGRRMLQQAGIPLDAFADSETRIPAASVVRLLEQSAAQSGCESFGLLLAERRAFASLGPVSLLLERLPTVREVVRETISYQRQLNDVVVVSLEDAGESCLIRLDLVPGHWGVQLADLIAGLAYRVLAGASGGRWKPAAVHVIREAPEDLAPWRRFFPAPIEFESIFSGFSSTPQDMAIPNPLADEIMASHARRLLGLVPMHESSDLAETVRRSIALLLPSGRATLDQVAVRLGVGSRTLQRRLNEEGRPFTVLLDEVRQDAAIDYLAGSNRPITAIAALLGYASPSSFSRWFADTFGLSPQEWRGRQGARDAPGPPPTWRR